MKRLFRDLGAAVFDLHLDATDELVWAAVAEFEENLSQGFLFVARLGVGALDAERFVELVNGDVAELYENLTE